MRNQRGRSYWAKECFVLHKINSKVNCTTFLFYMIHMYGLFIIAENKMLDLNHEYLTILVR